MANRTFTGETDSNLNTATNWALDTAPSDGDTIILDADSNAPDGYADGTPPETPLTTAGTFSLSLAGGARVVLTDMLSDLGDVATQHLNNVVVDGASSWLNNDSAGTVGGTISVSNDATLATAASFACTGGITVTNSAANEGCFFSVTTVTSDLVMAGCNLYMSDGTLVGNLTATAGGNNINASASIFTGPTIQGSVNLGGQACLWTVSRGFSITIDQTSTLDLGVQTFDGTLGASGIYVNIEGTGITVTAGANISCGTLTLTEGTYVAAVTHTVATNQVLTVAGSSTLTLTDTGLHVQAAVGTCTLGGDLSCATLRIEKDAIVDGGTNGLTLAGGRIHGYGTLKNLVPAGIIHVAYGVIDGGNNSANVIFDPQQKMVIV